MPDVKISTKFGRPNPHCVKCGDERGGPWGHETSECLYRDGMTTADLAATMSPERRAAYWGTLADRYLYAAMAAGEDAR